MQERNFERQIKQTLEEFIIPPSAPVWQKVEKEIRRERQRRRIIIWMLPVLLGGALVLGVYYFGGNKQEQLATDKAATIPSATNTDRSGSQRSAEKQTSTETSTSNNNQTVTSNNTQTVTSNKNNTVDETALAGRPAIAGPVTSMKRGQVQTASPVPGSKGQSKPSSNKAGITRRKTSSQKNVALTEDNSSSTTSGQERTDIAQPVTGQAAPPVIEKKNEAAPSPVKTEIKEKKVADSPAASTPVPANKRKWQVGLQASAGFSQFAETLLAGTKAGETNVVPNSLGYIPTGHYSEPGFGKHFSAGIGLTTRISSFMNFTMGLNYTYAGNVQNVGDRMPADSLSFYVNNDKSQPYVWTNDGTNNYTNHYHFIELPVGLDVKAFPSLPIVAHAGASVSRLIASNALQYDQGRNLYFRNNDMIRKTAANVYAGLSYGLFKDRLHVGPEFRYALTPLSDSAGRHLMSAGIKLKLSL